MLKNVCGIRSYPYNEVEKRVFSEPMSQFKDSAKRLLSQFLKGYPGKERTIRIDPDTVLIVDHAERMNSNQMFNILFHAAANGGKLLLVEGDERTMMQARETYFHWISSHIDALDFKFSESHYRSFTRDILDAPSNSHRHRPGSQEPELQL